MNFQKFRESTIDTPEQIQDLNEAKFSNKNLKKVSELLAKIASKKLGADFQFAWMDEFKKSNGDFGKGYRFMSLQGKQIRFNHVQKSKNQYAVNSVDYWKPGAKLTEPSLTVSFEEGINIVQIKEQLFDSIKAGKVVPIKIKDLMENASENLHIILDESKDEKKERRQEFAKMNDIPDSYANSLGRLTKKAKKLGLEDELDNWMNISTNVSEKTQFDYKIREDQKKLGPTGVWADPKYVFQDMEEASKIIAKGLWRSMVIVGAPGIGKTYGTKQTLTQLLGPASEGLAGKWIFKTGEKASAFGVYKTLLLNKHKVVVFDDSDSIWRDKDIINMLKAATADDGDRYISWGSGAAANVDLMSSQSRQDYEDEYISELLEDPNTKMKPPSRFLFEGQFINISNLPGSAFASGDLEAIASRSLFIDLKLAERDVLRRIATLMGYDGDSEEEIKEILDVIAPPSGSDAITGKGKYAGQIQYMTPDDAQKNKTINMRTANIARALRDGKAKDWKRMAGLYS